MDNNPPPIAVSEDKTVAILSYITLVGFIVALVLNTSKKTRLGAYHLRQTLGFFLSAFLAGICVMICLFIFALIPILNLILVPLTWLAFAGSLLGLWLMGFIAAIKGEMKPMPFVGSLYQKWFGTTFD